MASSTADLIVRVMLLAQPAVLAEGGGGVAGSCEGFCGGQANGCYCDEACVQYGDCCEDVCEACGLHCGAGEGGAGGGGEPCPEDLPSKDVAKETPSPGVRMML